MSRLRALRKGVARLMAGVDVDRFEDRIRDLETEIGLIRTEERRDLMERIDTLVSSYDRRVAALANRVLDLEERIVSDTEGLPADSAVILAAYRDPSGPHHHDVATGEEGR